jgi:hypothetical protein
MKPVSQRGLAGLAEEIAAPADGRLDRLPVDVRDHQVEAAHESQGIGQKHAATGFFKEA